MFADDGWLGHTLQPVVGGRRRVICCHSANLSGRHAPNSLEAVVECGKAGVPRLEVDVRFAADDAMVCFHDAELDRLTTSTGAVEVQTALTLREVTFRATGERLAFLEEVVDVLRPTTSVLQIDLKLARPITPERVRRLELALEPLGERVIVGSQSPWNLRRVSNLPVAFDPTLFLHYTSGRREAPYPRQRGIHGFWDDSPLALNPHAGVHQYLEARIEELQGMVPTAVEWMVDIATVLRMAELGLNLGEALAERGIALAAWTLRERDPIATTLELLWRAGATTVITDLPMAVAETVSSTSGAAPGR